MPSPNWRFGASGGDSAARNSKRKIENMKLELVKKYELNNIDTHWSCVALNEDTSVSLVTEKENSNYSLFFFNSNYRKSFALKFGQKGYKFLCFNL